MKTSRPQKMTKSSSSSKSERVTIAFTGDVMIGRLVNEFLDTMPPEYIWGDTLQELIAADLRVINLEAALTTSADEVSKVFNFKADPVKVKSLTCASIDLVNLANNHVLDYSEEGLLETLHVLDRANIQHVGAGRNITQAKAPVIFSINGIRIGFLGCTDNESSWLASESSSGTFYLKVDDFKSIQKEIAALRPQVDFLVLTIHWGPNMVERPPSSFVRFAHQLMDAGVDLLHGHSAHIFQGIEIYKRKPILYDTGDYVDDYYVDPQLRNDRSFLFLIEIGKQGVHSIRLIPVLISNFQVNHAHGDDASSTLRRMQSLSSEFNTHFEIKGEVGLLNI